MFYGISRNSNRLTYSCSITLAIDRSIEFSADSEGSSPSPSIIIIYQPWIACDRGLNQCFVRAVASPG